MFSKDIIVSQLAKTEINGTEIVMRDIQLRQLLKAHKELEGLGICMAGKKGFVSAPELTCSWRSLTLQQQLMAKGASKTLASHHRRGVAIDCYADWDYINKIKPIMNKYGFFNDLAYVSRDWKKASDTKSAETPIAWDGGHWNWVSNTHAWGYPYENQLPQILKTVNMNEYENCLVQLTQGGHKQSGSFALVLDGERHIIKTSKEKDTLNAILTVMMRGMTPKALTIQAWESIPEGDAWHEWKR